MTRSPVHLLLLACAASGVLLAGCAALPTASSLEVAVDVYTGPLSQSDHAQIAEAYSSVDSAQFAYRQFMSGLTTDYPGYRDNLYQFCDDYQDRLVQAATHNDQTHGDFGTLHEALIQDTDASKQQDKSARRITREKVVEARTKLPPGDVIRVDLCYDSTRVVYKLRTAKDYLWKEVNRNSSPAQANKEPKEDQGDSAGTEPAAAPATQDKDSRGRDPSPPKDFDLALQVAAFMKDRAAIWASAHIGTPVPDRDARERIAQFANLSYYYANLISTRVDLYNKLRNHKLSVEQLPTGDYLRDSAASDYLGLFDWYNTSTEHWVPGGRAFGPAFIPGADGLNVEDRIRAAKTLFGGRYWTQINEVMTSGQGEVRKAFIKDDIGNWSLKSFDNNPEELLAAYRDASIAGLQAVAKFARNGAAPGSSFLDFASNLTRGKIASGESALAAETSVSKIRRGTAEGIDAVRKQLAEDNTQLATDEKTAKDALSKAKSDADDADSRLKAARDTLLRTQARLDQAKSDNATDSTANLTRQEATEQEQVRALELESARKATARTETDAAVARLADRRKAAGERALALAQAEIRAHRRAREAIRDAQTAAPAPSPGTTTTPPANSDPATQIKAQLKGR